MARVTHERISDHIVRIVDPCKVAVYLVTGGERCVLLDTGCGCVGLRNEVESLTDLPVTVLVTHGHVDHAFGAGEFGEAFINMSDVPVYLDHSDNAYRKQFVRAILGEGASFELVDPLPLERFSPLRDGDIFDLGGVAVRVLSVPGHTMGMMVAYIDADETMLLGDACGQERSCSRTVQCQSMCTIGRCATSSRKALVSLAFCATMERSNRLRHCFQTSSRCAGVS